MHSYTFPYKKGRDLGGFGVGRGGGDLWKPGVSGFWTQGFAISQDEQIRQEAKEKTSIGLKYTRSGSRVSGFCTMDMHAIRHLHWMAQLALAGKRAKDELAGPALTTASWDRHSKALTSLTWGSKFRDLARCKLSEFKANLVK